eukprot:COSAG01_NODE_4432_length_5031_cov_3.848540_2_plen_66_part_00
MLARGVVGADRGQCRRWVRRDIGPQRPVLHAAAAAGGRQHSRGRVWRELSCAHPALWHWDQVSYC